MLRDSRAVDRDPGHRYVVVVRVMTALAVALCLTLSGSVSALDRAANGCAVITGEQHELGDVALVKPSPLKPSQLRPSQKKPQPDLSPELAAQKARAGLELDSNASAASSSRSSTGAPAGSIRPAALVCFASHPTRAGP